MTNQRPTIGVGTLQLTTEAKQLVMQVLDSNRLSYGPMSQTFEETFAEIHGCQFGVVSPRIEMNFDMFGARVHSF